MRSEIQEPIGEDNDSERPLDRLIAIMAQLRHPDRGCPWDLDQSFATIAPYTVEEAYEVADAIERGDFDDLRDELGDLLFQVVFHARMAEEAGKFSFDDVAEAICNKMIRRHPHVFGEAAPRSAEGQTIAWEDIKAVERAQKGKGESLLDDIPEGLPGLTRAVKLSKRAARVGFVWPSIAEVFDKLDEEIQELKVEVSADDKTKIRDELGDVLFVIANIARTLDIDPEDALRSSNAKFVRRFRYIETELKGRGTSPEHSSLAEMDALWNEAKQIERI